REPEPACQARGPPGLRVPQPRQPAPPGPHRLHPRPPTPVTHHNHQQDTNGNRTATRSRLTSKARLTSALPNAGRLDEPGQAMENIGEREPQPDLPLLRVMACIRRCRTPFLGSVKGSEDLLGILVFFVEVLCLLDPHAHDDAPVGLGYVLPRAKTSLD